MASRSQFFVKNALFAGLIGLCIFYSTQSSSFLTFGNFKNIAIQSSILAVVTVALTLLVIAGQLDLSIGSTVGLCGLLAAYSLLNWHWDPTASIAFGIVIGTGVGIANGTMCALFGFSPIIVTLGMLGALRGATLLITVTPVFGLGQPYDTLGRGTALGVPILVWIAIGAFALGAVFLALTPWGRYVYAIGVNPQAAFLSGLPVRALPFFLYVVTGTASGIAGVLFAARLDGAAPADLGIGMEISALTAILLGGVAFAGGRGSLFGVFVAVVFLGVLQDGLILMNVQPFVAQLAQGMALVAAAALDVAAARIGRRSRVRALVERQLAGGGAAKVVTPAE